MRTPRIAFLILAHGDAQNLTRLCRHLSDHTVFVHVDAKAGEDIAAHVRAMPNVRVIEDPVAVHWADFSMIEATLRLLDAATAEGGADRYVLLSGACYPVKPVAAIEALFGAEPLKEWIAMTPITDRTPHLQTLVGRQWHMAPLIAARPGLDRRLRDLLNKFERLRGRDLSAEIDAQPMFGSQWWALTAACVTMIRRFIADRPDFVQAYRSVYAPDEHFFQTIVGNSPFRQRAIEIADDGEETNKAAPLHLVHPSGRRTFGSAEADFLLAQGTDKLFIRKVSTAQTSPLLDRIDRELLSCP